MHLNFGITNNKLSNVLSIDKPKYVNPISYTNCDLENSCYTNKSFDICDSDQNFNNNFNSNNNNNETNISFSDVSQTIDENSGRNIQRLAVRVCDLKFRYKKWIYFQKTGNKVLNNCSLNLTEAKIYALLGSSGCGKTTLLKCILGRLKPDSGSVRVFGFEPNTKNSAIPGPGVGYMPQELALFGEVSIEDTLKYFGRINGLNIEEINEKIDFLVKFLDLPNKTKLVSQLSGGQQRRVSLTVTLLHNPKLLILDEPTVGLDPLLIQKIWSYLNRLSTEGNVTVRLDFNLEKLQYFYLKSFIFPKIMITTHYIEEARNAGTVGLMRGGRLLAEDNPEVLMHKYNSQTLEEVFLKLCQFSDRKVRQELDAAQIDSNNNPTETSVDNFAKQENNKHFNYYFSWFRVLAIYLKVWNKVKGNKMLFLAYFLPSIQLSIFCASVGKDPRGLNIAVFNNENPINFTKHFLNSLDNDIMIQNKYSSLETAIESIESGKSWAAISLPSNFTKCLKIRIRKGSEASNKTIACSNIGYYPDMSNAVISLSLIKTMIFSLQKFFMENLSKFGYNPNSISFPVQVKEVIYGTFEPSVQDFMAPGMVIALIFFAPFGLTALTLLDERVLGTLDRSLIAGVKPLEILFAHLLIQLSVLTIEVFLMVLTTFYIWKIPNYGNILEVYAIVYLQGMSGIALGLFVASIIPDKIFAMIVGMGIIFPSWVTCGVFWPIESMRSELRFISYFLPLTAPIESMRFIISRGWDITYFPVILGFISSFAYIFVFFFGAVIIFKWFV